MLNFLLFWVFKGSEPVALGLSLANTNQGHAKQIALEFSNITLINISPLFQVIDPKSLSPGSRKSTYSRMWSVKFPGRQRRTTVSEMPSHGHNNNHDLIAQDPHEFFKNYDTIVNK